MYILLVGFPPFSSRTNNQEELFDQILSGMFEFNSPDWDDITYSAKELISWMLQVCITLKSIGLNTYFYIVLKPLRNIIHVLKQENHFRNILDLYFNYTT